MKILKILLAAVLCLSFITASAFAAAAAVYTADFNEEPSGNISSFVTKNASVSITGNSVVLFNHKKSWERDDSTEIPSFGTRRSGLYSLSDTVEPGTYEITLWLCDNNNALTRETTPDAKVEWGCFLTFHDSAFAVQDLGFGYEWQNENYRSKLITVFNRYEDGTEEKVKALSEYFLKPDMQPTGNTKEVASRLWQEYKCTWTFDDPVTGVIVWSYQPAGYDYGAADKTDGIYVDNLTISDGETEITTAEETTEALTTEGQTTDAATTDAPTENTTDVAATDVKTTDDETREPLQTEETGKTTDEKDSFPVPVIVIGAVITAAICVVLTIVIIRKRKNR